MSNVKGCRGTSKYYVDGMALSKVATKLGMTYSMVYEMYHKGFDTIYTMKKYREAVANGQVYKRGATVHLTSEGKLTVEECVNIHPHGLSKGAIDYRGKVWGWNHLCLWLPSQHPKAFKKAAIELDGPPRGRSKPREQTKKKRKLIDRFLVCHKNKGQEICKHYNNRMNMPFKLPKTCKKYGTSCGNYAGIRNDVTSKPMSTVAWCE
jgi:hypothetical protein